MRVRGASAAAVTAALMAILLVSLRPAPAALTIHKVDTARFTVDPDKPVFVLVMGNDGRPGDTITRGDALHLIGVNPGQGKATILDIPRDTYLAIPGHGRDKINAAHAAGGPALQARAVGALVGVDVPFVVDTDFQGFMGMVDEMGGVDVDVPFPMSDRFSGAFFPAGRVHMDGFGALAFARNRNIAGGDIRRTENQGLLILAGLAKLRAENAGAVDALRHVSVLARHARVEGAGLRDLYRLARLALSLDPQNVRHVVMPGAGGRAGAASVVFVGPGADGLFADLRDDAVLQSH
ncbi:MAG TPA: LCP family protein [Acidimicrobiales bacterium]|nr:LCP family protein [Acidimicrobiales bacterium]